MDTAITAIGTANPPYRQPQRNITQFICEILPLTSAEKRLFKSLHQATGIEFRYTVLADYQKKLGELEFFPNDPSLPFPSTGARMEMYKNHALTLALDAIDNCFAQLPDFSPKTITHLITMSCTGMYAPGLDVEIVQHLNLSSTTHRTAINFMGCYAVFNGLKVANAICKADPTATVLLVSVELCTLHFQKNNSMDNLISSAIFADGAAATIVQANPAQKKYFDLISFHSDIVPQTEQEMAWYIGDSGFDMLVTAYVPEAIKFGIAKFTQQLLQRSTLALSKIDFYAIHPGGIKILQACEEALDITVEDNRYSYQVLRNYGNMSSATILFVLKAIWDDINANAHQKNIFGCAFGPGLTLESMLLRVHHV